MLPQLEALYQTWHKGGLEIVGINFDQKVETGHKVCKSLGLTYPQVWVPSDAKTRELWDQASGIAGLPRVLLIDREGILRADGHDKLEEQIAKLMAQSADPVQKGPK
jgi:hypothetical protein